MGLTLGTWVDLGDGQVGLVSAWNEGSGQAEAETPAGKRIERPIPFASSRWRQLPEDGLRVAAAQDLPAIRSKAEDSPTDIVVLALREFDGRAETAELRSVISPLVIADRDWKRWWSRAQIKLDDDPRVDATKARERRYSLRGDRESVLGRSLDPAIRDETRRDRRVADGPQLKRARDRAVSKGPRDPDDERLFEVELAIAADPTVDATDRFMSLELGLWLQRWSAEEAKGILGADVLSIDLLRIPQHQSKTRAVEWALERADADPTRFVPGSITFRSAAAAGPPWWDQVLAGLGAAGPGARDAAAGVLGWSVPGDQDSGAAKLKDELPTFERRIARAESMVPTLSQDALVGIWDGVIAALRDLPESQTYGPLINDLSGRIARLAWAVFSSIDEPVRPRLRELEPLPRDRIAALVRTAPAESLQQLREAVLRWYGIDPAKHQPALRVIADAEHGDLLALSLEAAGRVISRTTVPRIAGQLVHQAVDAKRTDSAANSAVNLAVTAIPEDPAVARALDRLADAAMATYEAGATALVGPITFSRSAWERFNTLVRAQIEESSRQEAAARREATEATSEAKRQRELAETRTQTLAEARTTAGSEGRQDAVRLAANLLKPVALAVGDSFESKSLDALQDRLLAVLQRGRIHPILDVGELAEFDPARHQWVGEGTPTGRVQSRSPGFVLEGEGGDDIVMVPARVVASGS